MGVEADLRIGSVLGVARGLLVADARDEVVEEVTDGAGVGVLGLGAGGSGGGVAALLVREFLFGGLVVDFFSWHDSVGDACLAIGSCHEGHC